MTGFGQLLSDLNEGGVRYVLIGGIALIRHGVVRTTRDVDVMLAPGGENRRRLRSLVVAWDATRPDGSPVPDETIATGHSIHLATPHGELDLLAERDPPLTFDELMTRADVRRVDGVSAPICSLADLVALKRIAGRPRDLADLADLADAHGALPDSRERHAPRDAGT